ncbi:cytochrome c biogenesis protein [Candidatus Avelusimicrobium luingense]|uniref:cytochrome c biogenesis protein n=1 Tax=Candidatus Avelusimicrobium luingense TaxID=3416211 RepID=UPI003D12F40B
MKKVLVALSLLSIFLWGQMPSFAQSSSEKVEFALFLSPTCVHCNKLKKEYLGKLKEKYKDTVHFTEYDISKDGNHLIFMQTAKVYGVPENKLGYPAAAVGSTFLMGYPTEIATYADTAIEKAQLLHEKTNVQTQAGGKENAEQAFSQITFWAIVGAGLVDGINPCAFAVIVFFISFLTVYKYTRREIIVVGISYCVAVFLAYLLLGMGVFKFLYAMRGFGYVIKAFYIITAGLCLVFFALSVYDFWIYTKTKKSDGMLLQLSLGNKTRIHKIMGFFLRDKNKNIFRLTLAALAVGFVVSLIEAVCTGQVYVPTCVLIMQNPAFRAEAVFYLVLYNLMFIVPLVLVFVLALLGYESKTFNDFLKRHLGLTKICLCLVFLGLFILLLGNI